MIFCWKYSGNALPRTPGAKMNSRCDTTIIDKTYAICGNLQTWRVRHSFDLDRHRVRLVATLCYEEGKP